MEQRIQSRRKQYPCSFRFGFSSPAAPKESPKDGINKYKYPPAQSFLSFLPFLRLSPPKTISCSLEPSRSPFISFIAVICRVLPPPPHRFCFLLTHFFRKIVCSQKHFVSAQRRPDPDMDSNAAILCVSLDDSLPRLFLMVNRIQDDRRRKVE